MTEKKKDELLIKAPLCNSLSARASFSAAAILGCLLRAVIQLPGRSAAAAATYVLYSCKVLGVVNGSGVSHGPQSATNRPSPFSSYPLWARNCLSYRGSLGFQPCRRVLFPRVCVCVCVQVGLHTHTAHSASGIDRLSVEVFFFSTDLENVNYSEKNLQIEKQI